VSERLEFRTVHLRSKTEKDEEEVGMLIRPCSPANSREKSSANFSIASLSQATTSMMNRRLSSRKQETATHVYRSSEWVDLLSGTSKVARKEIDALPVVLLEASHFFATSGWYFPTELSM